MSRYVTPVKNVLKRAFTDYNEAAGHTDYFGGPDPYYFVTPEPLREYLNSPARQVQIQMRPAKRMRMALMRRRSGRRRVLKFKRSRGRARRSWKVKARAEIGRPRTTFIPTKTRFAYQGDDLYDAGNLYQVPINGPIPVGVTRSERVADTIDFRGVRSTFIFRNASANAVTINLVWVVAKTANALAIKANPTAPQIDGNLFFRAITGPRTIAFSALNGVNSLYRPINSDDFAVIKRKRYLLPGVNEYQGNCCNIRRLKTYIKINRQQVYDEQADEYPKDGQFFFIWWVQTAFAGAGNASPNLVQMQHNHMMVWKDP